MESRTGRSGGGAVPRRYRKAILVGVLLAAVLGTAGALGRANAVWKNAGHDPRDGTLTGYDRMGVELAVALTGIDRASDRYREYEADSRAFVEKYYTHRLATFLHVVPGALALLLIPLQFSSRLRSRHIVFHRWSGRVILLAVIPISISGFFFATMPFAGLSETLAAFVFGGLFLFVAFRALVAIRRGEIARHREWMIRLLAVAIGVETIRVVDLLLIGVFEMGARAAFGVSIWLGWIVTLGAAEIWILSTRPGAASRRGAAVQPMRG